MKLSRCAMVLAALFVMVLPAQIRAEEGQLPPGVDPLPADLTSRMKNLIQNAEKWRGLPCKRGVPCGALAEEGLRRQMTAMVNEELPQNKMQPLEASLKAFGFIPESMDLATYYPKLLTSQVGGYYDPRRKYMVLVKKEGGTLGKAGRDKYGAELADRMEDTILVHELTHALQDQHFDLKKFGTEQPLSDVGAAHLALIEGDATLTMYNFFSMMNLEDMPGIEALMNQTMQNPEQLMAMTPDMPGVKEMSEAPAWIREGMLFSYMQGYMFCMSVKHLGGQKLLDYAFKDDPPMSTEQIMHPEKWHSRRDDPIEIVWPDLADTLPGYAKVNEGQLGEMSIKILLRENKVNDGKATVAAAGWGGDRFALYQKGNERLLLWITEWDSAQDAQEFKEAAAGLGKNWVVDSGKPTRVQLIKGNVGERELVALKARLNDAPAKQPANQALDLAKLGINKDAAQTGGAGDLAKLLGGSKSDLEAILKDPQLKIAKQFFGDDLLSEVDKAEKSEKAEKDVKKEPAKDNTGGIDLGALAKDPQVQELLKSMLTQERPVGKLSADGKVYTNEKLGFELKLPASQKEWTLNPKPPMPMASVMASNPAGDVQATVVIQTMPIAVPIDLIGGTVEMGPKMTMQNYRKIKAGPIEFKGAKGFELEYEGSIQGQTIHALQRVFVRGNDMIVVSAQGTPERWILYDKAAKEILDGFALLPQKEKEPAKTPGEK